jgi:hypothetical protein
MPAPEGACLPEARLAQTVHARGRCGAHGGVYGVHVCPEFRPRGRQEELDFNLVVFSPYRDLMVFLKDAGMLDAAECAWCVSCRDSSR